MSVWVWVVIAASGLLVVSVVVGLAVAAILGRISREVSDLLDSEPWASEPLTRAKDSPTEVSVSALGSRKTRR